MELTLTLCDLLCLGHGQYKDTKRLFFFFNIKTYFEFSGSNPVAHSNLTRPNLYLPIIFTPILGKYPTHIPIKDFITFPGKKNNVNNFQINKILLAYTFLNFSSVPLSMGGFISHKVKKQLSHSV